MSFRDPANLFPKRVSLYKGFRFLVIAAIFVSAVVLWTGLIGKVIKRVAGNDFGWSVLEGQRNHSKLLAELSDMKLRVGKYVSISNPSHQHDSSIGSERLKFHSGLHGLLAEDEIVSAVLWPQEERSLRACDCFSESSAFYQLNELLTVREMIFNAESSNYFDGWRVPVVLESSKNRQSLPL